MIKLNFFFKIRPKYHHDKNANTDHECRRRLEMLPSGSCKGHHHHHHHHHHYSSKHSKEHHHHHSERKKQHQYVNAIPPGSLSHRSNRYINQSDLCTQIISGNLSAKSSSDQNLQSNECLVSFSSNSSDSSTDSHKNAAKIGGSVSICTSSLQHSSADNSMRCTLKRGRPNTPKTGLSVDYRIRKSSVPNTPECKIVPCPRANNTISNDDIIKPKKIVNSVSSTSLNTAMVLDQEDDENADKVSIVTNNQNPDDLNDARILDIAFNGDEDLPDEYDSEENICEVKIEDNFEDSGHKSPKLSRSFSLSNLNSEKKNLDLTNQTTISESVSESVNKLLRKKSLSADVLLNDSTDNDSHMDQVNGQESLIDSKTEYHSNPIIQQQQKMIQFEPFEFKDGDFIKTLDQENNKNQNMLQSCLRRQSLFKLKETINGKVSKQVSEIEQRKLSPYRFSNSPLRMKKFKDSSSSLNSRRIGKIGTSPIRVPSIFCKKILKETPREHYIIKNEMEQNGQSPKIFRKLNRNRSFKRLNMVSNQVSSNLSSIAENENGSILDESRKNTSQAKMGSPVGKNLIMSKDLICSTESIDL